MLPGRPVGTQLPAESASWVLTVSGGADGAAQSQRAVQGQGGRPAGGGASGGHLLGGGANEPEYGDGKPRGGERAVEVAGELASPDNPLELGGTGVVGVVAAGRVPGEGGAKAVGVPANERPADVEELAQRVGGRGSVEAAGVDGGDCFRSQGVE